MRHVIGVDAGGTSTRVAVISLDGVRVGYGRAGGGNPSAHGLPAASAAIGAALRDALAGVDPGSVAGSLAGVAGNAASLGPELDRLWASHGLPAGPRLIGDVLVAYAAGTAEPAGTILLAGTGSIAARIAEHDLADVVDGLGWLLGDGGSGFWIGRAAVKAVVHTLDRRAEEGPLVKLVAEHYLGSGRSRSTRGDADRIVRLAQADPLSLAALSPLVSASAGDPVSDAIIAEAAALLAEKATRLHTGGPIVLAGSVLTNEGPVRRAVQDLLGAEPVVTTAADGAGAAAWLAALDLLTPAEATRLHPGFTTSHSDS